MTRRKRWTLTLATAAAVGLLSAYTLSAQEDHGPPPGGPPHNGSVDRPAPPGPPPGGRDMDDDRQPGPPPVQAGPRRGPDGAGPRRPDGPPRDGQPPAADRPHARPFVGNPGTGPMPEPPGGRGGPQGGPGNLFDWRNPADPEMGKLIQEDVQLEQQVRHLAHQQYPAASKEDRAKIKVQVVKLIGKQFDVRQQRRTLELKRLEEELKRLREVVDKRAKSRDRLIEKRVSQLIAPDEGDEF